MHGDGGLGLIIAGIALGGPLLLGLAGIVAGFRARPAGAAAPGPWSWRLVGQSALLYAIAFNLTFFIQELFLVVPKAFVPGLNPTLYHNNHNWTGDDPLGELFQGTGALAILISGLVFAALVARGGGRTSRWRLFFIWMAYHGFFQALPQLATVALSPGSDVARALTYLQLTDGAKAAASLTALAGMIFAGLWLTRPLLETADHAGLIDTAGRRTRYAFAAATLPALAAIPLIILYRIPRETIEVVLPPIAVTIVGISWIQANAWRVANARPNGLRSEGGLAAPLLVALAILAVFQLVLRPGIPFY